MQVGIHANYGIRIEMVKVVVRTDNGVGADSFWLNRCRKQTRPPGYTVDGIRQIRI